MSANALQIIIVAGEASGDLHAAHLVEHLRQLNPRLTFSGLGGEKMKKQGVEIYDDLTRMAVIGFVEVLKHYREIKKIFDIILKKINEIRPAAVILVDYPGFNLRLAKAIKRTNPECKVIYYISPQVWAWKENRVEHIRTFTDKMLVLFEFEKIFYAKHHLDVEFVGHPLVDDVKTTRSKTEMCSALKLSPHNPIIGILPGSRQKEIETLLPIMSTAAKMLRQKNPSLQFLLCKAPTVDHQLLQRYLSHIDFPISIVENHIYDGIEICDACMVASGTATLETAILNTPMVVIYKTSFLTWLLARYLIKIPYIGLVNVVAGKKIVPECIQFEATPERIADELNKILANPSRLQQIKSDLTAVKLSLGSGGASRRTAEAIHRFL